VPNREHFTDQLDRAIARARRVGGKIALFYLDLDQFKSVNDTLGHEAGDALLKSAADRLQEAIRTGDLLARLGGDEFAIIVENLERARHAESIARHLVAAFDEPFELNGRKLSVTPSIGITVHPDDSTNTAALLKNADIAMYKAKEDGRNSYKFFTERMHKDLVTRHKMEEDIKVALDNDEFLLLYQPKVDMRNYRLKGMEALIRWDNPERGIVSPMDFIPAAEEGGYIVPLGYWVLEEMCRTLKRWEWQKLMVPPISINVSVKQFQQADFAKRVALILDSHHVDPSLIELEITEGLLMEDTASAKRALTHLKDIGVRISIDDFGTGHSCLAFLLL
jgi:diguanylate cyclase (GGDEF)-like protein